MIASDFSGYTSELYRLLTEVQTTTPASSTPLSLDNGIRVAAGYIEAVRDGGGKVILVGNGGSAAIVSHMHNDLNKAVGVRAIVLTETGLLTALTNDLGYEHAYEKQVIHWAEADDLLLAVSSSGKSQNILRAVAAAREKGCRVVTLTGFAAENPLRQLGDVNYYVDSTLYGYVELAHQVITHFLTDCLMRDEPHMR